MKVIQIMDDLIVAGGVNSFVYDLCEALFDQGIDVSLIGIIKKGDENNSAVRKLKEKGIRVECLGALGKKEAILHYLEPLKDLIEEIADGEKTICNLHLKLSVLMGGLACARLKNVKCVETYHSLYSKYWLEHKVMSPFIKKYIPCSESAFDEMIKRFRTNRNRLVAIPNGVNGENLRRIAEENAVEKSSNCVAVSVGRLTNQKNFHITCDAFADLKPEGFEYRIFGDDEGAFKEKILVASRNSKNIKLYGLVSRERVLAELKNADIVVMPSLWEGLSIFLLEAISLGCPMMISDVPSMRNVFHEAPLMKGESWRCCSWGYLVETSNSKAYREAMEHFIDNPDLRFHMAEKISVVAIEYDMKNTADLYLSVYKAIS